MIAMQYRINLPSDYNMKIIKDRVQNNGFKTDGFDDLLFKCYLIQEKGIDGFENSYSPLYLWKDCNGMNKFLFDGYYDNIIGSFGWQNVSIGIPLLIEQTDDFSSSQYVTEITNEISPNATMADIKKTILDFPIQDDNFTCKLCIYNPDKWNYSVFCFYKQHPNIEANIYKILHISQKALSSNFLQ